MRAAIRPDTRIVWIANPNNPTGNFLPYPEIRAFLESVPKDVVVVLDEAYNEYLPPAERVDTASWIKDFPEPGGDPHLLENFRSGRFARRLCPCFGLKWPI